MKTDRIRILTRQWRYLSLPVAFLAVISWQLIPGKINLAAANDEQMIIGLIRQMAEGVPKGDYTASKYISTYDLLDSDGNRMSKTIMGVKSHDFLLTRFEVGDFRLTINGDQASVELAATLFAKNHFNGKEINLPGKYSTKLIKLKGQWHAVETARNSRLLPSPSTQQLPLPPPPPPPPSHLLTVEANQPLKPLPGDDGEDSVFTILRKMADAQMRGDEAAVGALLSDEFSGVATNGEKFGKSEMITEGRKLAGLTKKFAFDDMNILATENLAVATFLGTMYYTADGKELTSLNRYTVTLSKIPAGNPLRIVSVHVTRKE